ncbi:LuxR family transcriptional regulator [soil metagenome]
MFSVLRACLDYRVLRTGSFVIPALTGRPFSPIVLHIENKRDAGLIGRADEKRTLQGLLTGARNGLGAALVILGEPGIGKTALLKDVTAAASEMTVLRSDGYEAESSIPYAALQRLGMALMDDVDELSARHQQALRVAWGFDDGPPPERFLVGMAMLALLAEAGGRRPVMCVVDDAHWLDSESLSVLAFVGRRLQAESAVLLFAARDHDDTDRHFAGLDSLRLSGLDDVSAVELLRRATTTPIDNLAATQIAAATGGNPLALIDLTHDLTVRRISDISLQLSPIPIGRQLEAHYVRQVAAMSPEVQEWLLVAAAEATGHPRLIASAAKRLRVSNDCAVEAQRAGLITVGDAVMFRHPLVRSAIYSAATGANRRRVHLELARAAAEMGLVEVEARNAAESTTDFDTAVAARVEAVADRAAKRGGLMSQARLLARAAELTPKGYDRNGRLLAAAEAAVEAGAALLSIQLLDRLDTASLDAVQRGRVIAARAFTGLFLADPDVVRGASAMMLQAAEQFHGHDDEREQKALLHAYEFMNGSEFLTTGTTLTELGNRLDAGARVRDGVHSSVLCALAALILRPYPEAVVLMRQALDSLLELSDADLLKFNYIGFIFSTALFDEAASELYLDRAARVARDAGALRGLDTVLWVRSLFELDRGDPSSSALYIEQVRELRRAIGFDAENVVNISYLIWTGTPRDQVEQIGAIIQQMGFGGVHTTMCVALGIRDLAEGLYDDAYRRIGPKIAERFVQVTDHQLADYVEAAARSGHLDSARREAARISVVAQASATPWIRGLDQRCQALLAQDTDAEPHYQRAIEYLGHAHTPSDLARAHLLYGEWLRRRKRRREARANLHTAVEILDRINAPALAQRARTELVATGEKISERQIVGGVKMSTREATVARMAAHGATNAEIAATLFISTNTVDYHLRKVFGKFSISSRRQLSERLGDLT